MRKAGSLPQAGRPDVVTVARAEASHPMVDAF